MIISIVFLILVLLLLLLQSKSGSMKQFPPNPNPGYKQLPINCGNNTNTNSYITCSAYIENYIEAFTGNFQGNYNNNDDVPMLPLNAGYSSLQIPAGYAENGEITPLIVYMSLQLDALQYIDTEDGIVSITSNIDIWWYDYRLSWNNSLNFQVDYVYIEPNWIWSPDINLFNQADGTNFPSLPLKLHSDGLVHLSTKAYLKAYCALQVMIILIHFY